MRARTRSAAARVPCDSAGVRTTQRLLCAVRVAQRIGEVVGEQVDDRERQVTARALLVGGCERQRAVRHARRVTHLADVREEQRLTP